MTGIDKAIDAAGKQEALASLLGVSQQAISKMKRQGRVSVSKARIIQEHFGIPLDELV